MSQSIDNVLKQLGWNDGFRLPISNVENKALEEELAKLSYRKQREVNKLDVISGRLSALNDNLKYVNQESDHTQKLITIHMDQQETLKRVLIDTENDNRNTLKASRITTQRLKEAENVVNEKETELKKLIMNIDKRKAELDWDCEALKAWEEALKKRDEDIELLRTFFVQDDRKFNQLEARRQHLIAEYMSVKEKIEKLATTTHNAEQMVERSGQVLKELGAERDSLINQWKDTVGVLQQRDSDIMRTQEQISELIDVVQKLEEKLEKENKFLINERKNNEELDTEIVGCNHLNSKYRKEVSDMYQYLMLTSVKLQTLKRQLGYLSHQLKTERIKYKRLEDKYEAKLKYCQQFPDTLISLNEKLEEVSKSVMSAEQRNKEMEDMIAKEDARYKLRLVDIEKINGEIYRAERMFNEQTHIASNLEIEINISVCTSHQLRKLTQAERKNLDKIKMVVYEMEYRIDECERKFLEMAETQKQEVPEEIQIRIQDLEKSLTEHKEVQHSLQSQLDRLREEMRRLLVVIAADKEVLEGLQNKCQNFLLIFDISKKQIGVAKKNLQEKQVEENMMKLRISHIEKDKKKEDKQIFNLEKLKLNLEQTMKVRQLEIDSQKQILLTKKRNLEEDKGRLRADLAIRMLKIEQYQNKYHLAISGLGRDDDGQPLTLTTMKIKNAQDKFFLQEEGDVLDNKIKTTEKEIIALENTLKIINFTNASFKYKLLPVTETDPEIEELHTLEEELKERFAEMKKCRKELIAKEAELEEVNQESKNIEGELQTTKEKTRNLEEEIEVVTKQLLDKEEKLKRVECELRRLYKQVKNKKKKDLYKYNKDFEIRYLQDTNKKVLSQLRELSISQPNIAPVIGKYLIKNSLELPDHRITPSSHSTFSTLRSCSSSELINTQRTSVSLSSDKPQLSLTKVTVDLGF